MRETSVHNQTPTSFDGRIAFTPSEVAEILGVDRGLIYRMIAARKFLVIRLGASYVVPRQSLDHFALGLESESALSEGQDVR
jgi:excisionase family DNA binding protein